MRSARRRSRELALQGLYQWQYTGESASQVLQNLSEMEGFAKADNDFLDNSVAGFAGTGTISTGGGNKKSSNGAAGTTNATMTVQ